MKARSFIVPSIALLATIAISARVVSQQERKPEQSQAQHDMGNTAPGPEHKAMAKYAGDWTTKSSLTAPGAPAQPPVAGTSRITAELGGRFFNDSSKGEMMGQPYESRHYSGYNNETKAYESIWTWTNDTGMLHFTGKSDDGGKTIKWTASYTEGGEKQVLNAVTKHIDDDHFTIELRSEGPDAMVMTTEYTRKK